MEIFKKRKSLAVYFLLFLWGLFIFVFREKFSLLSWYLSTAFLFYTIVPGYFLAKGFRFQFIQDRVGQIILWFALGLAFNLILAFIAMVFGFNITIFSWMIWGLIVLLYIWGLYLVFKKPYEEDEKFNFKLDFKKIFQLNHLFYLVIFTFIVLILVTIDQQGADFRGDPYFHLAILRKVVENGSLYPANLNFIKTSQLHTAYGFPIWHIFLGFITVSLKSNIFTVWSGICLALSGLTIVIWYWVYRRIFGSRDFALVATIFFILFTYLYKDGYMFRRLPVPDTLGQFILLPLVIGLFLKYVSDKKTNYKTVILFSLLALLMGAIHLTQYVYFFLILIVFALVMFVFQFFDQDAKWIFRRILWSILANLVAILPLAAALELKGKVVSNTLTQYWATDPSRKKLSYAPFVGVEMMGKYAYFFLPLVIAFWKKNKIILFLLAIMIVMPLAYSQTIGIFRDYLIRLFGLITMNRLYANVVWDHAVWGLAAGFVFVLIDRIFSLKLKFMNFFSQIISLILLAGFVYLAKWEFANRLLEKAFKNFNSIQMAVWLNERWIYIIGISLLIALIVLVWQRFSPKLQDFFSLTDFKNKALVLAIFLPIAFMIFTPNYRNFANFLKWQTEQDKTSFRSYDQTNKATSIKGIGGWATVNFIKENIPAKSVFIVDKNVQTSFPEFVDQYMAYYPRTSQEKEALRIYRCDISFEDKIKYLTNLKAEYILMSAPTKQCMSDLDNHPEYFKQVYYNNVAIYKVNIKNN